MIQLPRGYDSVRDQVLHHSYYTFHSTTYLFRLLGISTTAEKSVEIPAKEIASNDSDSIITLCNDMFKVCKSVPDSYTVIITNESHSIFNPKSLSEHDNSFLYFVYIFHKVNSVISRNICNWVLLLISVLLSTSTNFVLPYCNRKTKINFIFYLVRSISNKQIIWALFWFFLDMFFILSLCLKFKFMQINGFLSLWMLVTSQGTKLWLN